jgi:hypothetical protein
MKTTDEQLIRAMRAELDELADGARRTPGDPPPVQPNVTADSGGDHGRRWVAIGVAAAALATLVGGLVVVANRDAGTATSDTAAANSPSVPPTVPTTAPATVAERSISDVSTPAPEATTVPPATAPATSAPATAAPPDADAAYEVIAPVLETAERGTQLCLGQWMISATPPVCDGPELQGWSWDFVGGGNPVTTGTWAEAYLAGTWDDGKQVFVVTDAHSPTAADHERFADASPKSDLSVPCAEPAGGWPARNQEWPEDQIDTIPGYAGSWDDPTNHVVTAKFTGDLAVAEAAVRRYYTDNLCVVPAQHSMDELAAIRDQLLGMSSVKWLWATVRADPTAEWVEVGTIVPDPTRQAAFDEQYGEGVVRLTARLQPL